MIEIPGEEHGPGKIACFPSRLARRMSSDRSARRTVSPLRTTDAFQSATLRRQSSKARPFGVIETS